jgi:hypothetical protein
MDDLRSWCTIDKEHPYSIPVYLDQTTMDTLARTFPYMVDASKATGGGDIPSFKYHIIEHDKDFEVEGITFTPLPGNENTIDAQCPIAMDLGSVLFAFDIYIAKRNDYLLTIYTTYAFQTLMRN